MEGVRTRILKLSLFQADLIKGNIRLMVKDKTI